jgi:hypothetical protein
MKTSVMLESYCADIERLVREGIVRTALPLALALPDIGSALEDGQMRGSRDRYLGWCTAWVTPKPVRDDETHASERLYQLYIRSSRRTLPDHTLDKSAAALAGLRRARRTRRERTLVRPRVWNPVNRLQAFQIELIEALVAAARRWYADQGVRNAIVQRNLGRLLVTG